MLRPQFDSRPPPLSKFLSEAFVMADWWRVRGGFVPAIDPARGDGRAVMVIPGFLTDDVRTLPLRDALDRAGYDAHGWGLGRNTGVVADLLDRLEARIAAAGAGAPVALVGWSLGGLYAREIAKR